jgi:sirohydrochlorin cobaltochelatase
MITDYLGSLLDAGYTAIGELEIRSERGGYRLFHHRDKAVPREKLRSDHRPEAAREVAKYTQGMQYRPLKGAPNLPGGWQLELKSLEELVRALDFIYPGAIAAHRAYSQGAVRPVPLRHSLNRQTGMYRITRKISSRQAEELISTTCTSQGGCLRTILWDIDGSGPISTLPASKFDPAVDQTGLNRKAIPFLCPEACNWLIAAARKVVKKGEQL